MKTLKLKEYQKLKLKEKDIKKIIIFSQMFFSLACLSDCLGYATGCVTKRSLMLKFGLRLQILSTTMKERASSEVHLIKSLKE
jgi:hypothetical protein